jgi:hypothetical protein
MGCRAAWQDARFLADFLGELLAASAGLKHRNRVFFFFLLLLSLLLFDQTLLQTGQRAETRPALVKISLENDAPAATVDAHTVKKVSSAYCKKAKDVYIFQRSGTE